MCHAHGVRFWEAGAKHSFGRGIRPCAEAAASQPTRVPNQRTAVLPLVNVSLLYSARSQAFLSALSSWFRARCAPRWPP
jgi:hypothetical protein